jgi:hypothetical protein
MKRLAFYVWCVFIGFSMWRCSNVDYPDPDAPPPCWNKLLNDPRCS